jgi:hydrogenase-4 component F
MIPALVLVPLLAGLAAYMVRWTAPRRALLVAVAAVHLGLTAWVWVGWPDPEARPRPVLDGWMALDAPGLLFLSILSVLFFAASIYAVGYLRNEAPHSVHRDFAEGSPFTNEPESVLVACLLLFLASMTAVTVSQHFGLLWVAVEATTLASAPLIYFHRHHRSLEATWKYLLVCSVGIALALPANFALAAAAARGPAIGDAVPLVLGNLLRDAGELNPWWLRAAMIFAIVGYGTKMGLAPMHTWLPDAHSEAPSLVSALMSGALLNCAFLAILRLHQVCLAAGVGAFSSELLVGFGLVSLAMAAIFIVRQADFKRLLAYSSVEHMGLLALGVGIGGLGTYGSALHALNHSCTKAGLFLVAGNILAAYGTRRCADVTGMSRLIPFSAVLWLAGFFAITGAPPFGVFLSEFTIVRAAALAGRGLVVGGVLLALAVIFIGMAGVVLPMTQGPAPEQAPRVRPGLLLTLPSLVLLAGVLLLGVWVPPFLREVLEQVARSLGGPLS